MQFLRRIETRGSAAWWAAVRDYPSAAPGVIRELLVSPSVVLDRVEAEQALAWARAHPAWCEDAPGFVLWRPSSSASGWD